MAVNNLDKKVLYAWRNMINRCTKPSCPEYKRYGARGIKVCDEWENFRAFKKWAVESGCKEGLSLDRIDNSCGYCPRNCRWTTPKAQANNTRSNCRIAFNGEMHTRQEWADVIGISSQALAERLSSTNWTLVDALTVPKKQRPVKQMSFRKKILQCSLDGKVKKEWPSITEACKSLNAKSSNISRVLKEGGTTKGFLWKYAI